MAQVLSARVPRALWMSGLLVSAVAAVIGLVVGPRELLIVVPFGLLLAAFPLLARADAIELDGPHLRVRRLVRWTGPVDLRQLVALVYRHRSARTPAAWLLVQRQAGPPLRWYWRFVIGRETYGRLRGQPGLRLVEVGAGGPLGPIMPGDLAAHLSQYVLSSDAIVDERARAALRRHRG